MTARPDCCASFYVLRSRCTAATQEAALGSAGSAARRCIWGRPDAGAPASILPRCARSWLKTARGHAARGGDRQRAGAPSTFTVRGGRFRWRRASLCRRERLQVPRRRLHRRCCYASPRRTAIWWPASSRPTLVALDPHKWLHAPFDVGCALVVRCARPPTPASRCIPNTLTEHARHRRRAAPVRLRHRAGAAASARSPRCGRCPGNTASRPSAAPIDLVEHRARRSTSRSAHRGRTDARADGAGATNIVCFRHRLPARGRSGAEGIQHRDPASAGSRAWPCPPTPRLAGTPLAARGDRQPPHRGCADLGTWSTRCCAWRTLV